ncbi:MAG: hypothetical protein ACLU8C_04620 [Lacrimispora saccharolytica]
MENLTVPKPLRAGTGAIRQESFMLSRLSAPQAQCEKHFVCPVHGCRPRRDFFVRLPNKDGTDLPTYFIHEKFIV